MRKIIRIAALSALTAVSMTAFAQTVPVESVTFTVTSNKLAVGGSRTYKAEVLPATATEKTVTWDSSDPRVATIDANGKVRGMAPGTTTLTAACGGKSASLDLTVSLKDAKVGYYLFNDGTWEQGAIVPGKTCVGYIYYVNADNRSGKAVSLDEQEQLMWSKALAPVPEGTDVLDGMLNRSKITVLADWEENFPAEAWCVAKSDDRFEWYLPAVDELRQLFAASCGLKWVESGADEANKEVNNWTGNSVTMVQKDGEPDIDPYPTERAAFNANLAKAGGTALSADKYWSSTLMSDEMATFLSFEGGYSNGQPKQYFHVCRTRAITRFTEPSPLTTGVECITSAGASVVDFRLGTTFAEVIAPYVVKNVEVWSMSGARLSAEVEYEGSSARIDFSALQPGTVGIITVVTDEGRNSARFVRR